MRAPLSIVIPTLNAEAELPDCLAALIEGLGTGLVREVLVTDGGSGDGTLTIARAAGAEVIRGPRGRGGQLRRGVAAARGAWVMILHADTRLSDGWSGAVLAHIGKGDGRAGYFRLGFRSGGRPGRIVAGWANLRARVFGLPYGDQGLVVSRAAYEAVGGFRDIALMEDVAIVRALKGRLTQLDARAMTSAVRYRRQGWVRRGARNWALMIRFLAGADPNRLARAYGRSAKTPD